MYTHGATFLVQIEHFWLHEVTTKSTNILRKLVQTVTRQDRLKYF